MTNESAEKKPTVRRRRRAARGGKGGMPRIMWLAVLVCIAGAVALFRSGGGGPTPTGLGENRTVVTAPEAGGEPVSGDVEIASEVPQFTPEQPVAGGELGGADNAPLELTLARPSAAAGDADGRQSVDQPAAAAPVPRQPADTPAARTAEPAPGAEATAKVETEEPARPEPTGALTPRVVPQPRGPYLVQA
ncbi:hypothetical protein FJ250_11000, partial [bacterium]|nr:hypothetical protein [bacterium]